MGLHTKSAWYPLMLFSILWVRECMYPLYTPRESTDNILFYAMFNLPFDIKQQALQKRLKELEIQ